MICFECGEATMVMRETVSVEFE